MKRITSTFLALILAAGILFSFPLASSAAGETNLPFGTWVSATMTNLTISEMFKVTVPSSGKLALSFRSFLDTISYDILDTDGMGVIKSFDVFSGSEGTPQGSEVSFYLEAGTYYVQARKGNNRTGRYEIRATFVSANVTETEPNDTPEQAEPLTLGKWETGMMPFFWDMDYYKVTIPSSGKLSLSFRSFLYTISYDLIDTDGLSIIKSFDVFSGSEGTPQSTEVSFYLEAGTYYVQARKGNNQEGKYELRATFVSANVTETEPNDTPEQAAPLTLGTWETGMLPFFWDMDYYKVTIPSSGKLVLNFRSFLDTISYDIFDTDGLSVIKSIDVFSGNESTPQSTEASFYLEAGTYYVQARKGNDRTGKYELRATFTSANVTEKEPNDTPAQAESLTLGTWKTGMFPVSLDVDYYKMTVKASEKITLSFRSYLNCIHYDIVSADGINVIKTITHRYGNEGTPATHDEVLDLAPGTYYVRARKDGNNAGKYEINLTHAHAWSAWKITKAATCVATGTQTRTCSLCKGTESKSVALLAHKSKTVITAKASTTKDGKSNTICSVCNKTLKTGVVIPKASSIALSATTYTYDGKEKKPSVTVKDSKGKALKNGTDYTVTYATGRKSIGSYAVKITFKGSYSGTVTKTFKINPKATTGVKATKAATSIKLTWTKQSGVEGYEIYDTVQKKIVATVKGADKNSVTLSKLTAGKAYSYKIRAYKTIGSTKFYGAYSAVLKTSTLPATPAISAVTSPKAKNLTVKWGKVASATGYEIQYSTDKTFKKSVTTKAVSKNATVSATYSGLVAGKTYYVRIRTYKTIDGAKVYSPYTAAKSVKIK